MKKTHLSVLWHGTYFFQMLITPCNKWIFPIYEAHGCDFNYIYRVMCLVHVLHFFLKKGCEFHCLLVKWFLEAGTFYPVRKSGSFCVYFRNDRNSMSPSPMRNNFGFITFFLKYITEDLLVLELCNSKRSAFQSSILRNNIMPCLFAFIGSVMFMCIRL